MEDLSKHIKEEETDELPALEKVLKSTDSEGIAKSFQRMRKFILNHSYPMAPQKLVPWDRLYLVLMLIRKRPPFETVLDLLTTPVDRLADIFRKFSDEDDKS